PFGGNVISSTEALSLDELPQSLAIIGAGYIGLELGIAFKKLGAAVTVIEAADRILPRYDEALTRPVRRWLQRAGVELYLGARLGGLDNKGKLAVETSDGKKIAVEADKILVTIGRSPDEAVPAGLEITTAQFPFAASGRALTLEAGGDGGFVRIVAQKDDQRVLGIQAVGHQIAELAGEFAHALAMGAVLDDLAHTIHVHPTLGEAIGEAALVGLGHGLHI